MLDSIEITALTKNFEGKLQEALKNKSPEILNTISDGLTINHFPESIQRHLLIYKNIIDDIDNTDYYNNKKLKEWVNTLKANIYNHLFETEMGRKYDCQFRLAEWLIMVLKKDKLDIAYSNFSIIKTNVLIWESFLRAALELAFQNAARTCKDNNSVMKYFEVKEIFSIDFFPGILHKITGLSVQTQNYIKDKSMIFYNASELEKNKCKAAQQLKSFLEWLIIFILQPELDKKNRIQEAYNQLRNFVKDNDCLKGTVRHGFKDLYIKLEELIKEIIPPPGKDSSKISYSNICCEPI